MSEILDEFLGNDNDDNGDSVIKYREIIEDMLNDHRYSFAEETLLGIWDYMNENDKVTSGQMKAVDNIRQSVYER